MPENKSVWNTITQCRHCGELNPSPTQKRGEPGEWYKYHRFGQSSTISCGPIEEFQMIPMGQWTTMINAFHAETQKLCALDEAERKAIRGNE